ncbi:hypothetical protein MM213_03345 [Belliella sp. R4-6]|uniref:Glycosyltransferase RgtA/B/C/D-like domain-containing protein n=1 Tax=Belliella alkalica TaxID=1730871 RepID=A0ABS9V7W9_9BACT|nr:hypothetical protein [Belliella alkalica]MCH7412507.1 hypothetical protein [Belliella alkalica]
MKKQSIIYAICWLLFSSAYFLLSLWLQSRGFYNLEAYFIEYKTVLISRYEEGFLRTFFFTKPIILFLGSLLISFIKQSQSTYILNAIIIGGLTNHLFLKGLKRKLSIKVFLIYVLLSPIIIYSGVSGGSTALYLIFYFVFFTLLFKYSKSYSVFHLTLLSLLLGVFVLFDLELLKFLLLLIPVFFFVNFSKAKGISGNFYYRASIIFSNGSQRRKFFTGFFSSIFIVAFIPLMTILIYLVINKIFAGSFLYFMDGVGDQWSSYSTLYPLLYEDNYIWNVIAENTRSFIIPLALVSCLIVFNLFDFEGSVAKNALILLGILYCFSEIAENRIDNLNLNVLSLITAIGLAVVFYNHDKEKVEKPFKIVLGFIIPFILIFLEVIYFKYSVNYNERLYYQSVIEKNDNEHFTSLKNLSSSLKDQEKGRVLVDDAIYFASLTDLNSEFTWEGHFSPNFLAAMQLPQIYADYIIVSKPAFLLYPNDVVAASLRRLEHFGISLDTEILYEDKFSMLLKVK